MMRAKISVAEMEDAFTGIQPLGGAQGPGDPVLHWRHEWEDKVSEAQQTQSAGGRLAASRRDYGSYLYIAMDIVLVVVTLFVLSIPAMFGVVLLYVVTGHSLILDGKLNGALTSWMQSPEMTPIELLITDGAMLLVLWYRLRRQRLPWSFVGLDSGLRRLGANFTRTESGRVSNAQAILFGLAMGVIALIASIILGNLLQRAGLDLSAQDKQLIEPLKTAPLWVTLTMVFGGTFVAPTVEELFFRGYIFRALAVRKTMPVAYLISAGVFAIFHLNGLDMLPLIPVLFVIGLLLCYAYRRTGNLLANITAHCVNNGVTFAIALLIPLLTHH
jgi:membrane protease YdiL (CAAX protease family)